MTANERSPLSEFIADTVRAVSAWRAVPMLPVTTALLYLVQKLGTLFTPATATVSGVHFGFMVTLVGIVVLAALFVLVVGFSGTQRMWYLRAFRGQHLRAAEVSSFTWEYFGRYFAIGLIGSVPILAVLGVLIAVVGFGGLARPVSYLMLSAIVVALDVAGTFISPALAFSTAHAREGIAIGLRMLRRTWPACAYYALCPPLALQVLAIVAPSGESALAVSLAVATALVSLIFKGSTVAFYMHHVEIGDGGLVPPVETADAH